jgi:tRNA (cytosine38-C5)-methyltransferase
VLKSRNYKILHFHLSPTQIGIPNDRPRYYSIAFRSIPNNSRLNLENMNIDLKEETKNWFEKYCTSQSNVDDLIIFSSIELLDVRKEEDIHTFQNDEISKYLDDPNELINEDLFVSEKLLNSDKSWCFDIITPSDRRSSCFTQSYGRYIRGTGSVLYIDDKIHSDEMENEIERRFLEKIQLVSPQDRKFDSKWADGVDLRNKLRYLSGTEIARLMGFPLPFSTENNDSFLNEDGLSNSVFQFPPHLTLRQQWKLLGNSINVHLAAKVAELGLRLVFVLGSKTV